MSNTDPILFPDRARFAGDADALRGLKPLRALLDDLRGNPYLSVAVPPDKPAEPGTPLSSFTEWASANERPLGSRPDAAQAATGEVMGNPKPADNSRAPSE